MADQAARRAADAAAVPEHIAATVKQAQVSTMLIVKHLAAANLANVRL